MLTGLETYCIGLAFCVFCTWAIGAIGGGVAVSLLRAWSEENGRNDIHGSVLGYSLPAHPVGIGEGDLAEHETVAIAAEE
jgi:hypothetical protein